MKIVIILSFVLIANLCSCTQQKHTPQNEGFKIMGTIENIPDSSWVFLQDNEKTYDSAMIVNNKFELTGQVNEPTNIFLIIKSTMDYKPLWVENNKMTFNAERGKFLDAIITGSETQIEADIYWQKIKPIKKPMDSLITLLKEGSGNKDFIQTEMQELENKQKEIEISYIRENPNSLISVQMLDIYKTTWGKELTTSLFTNFSKKLKITDKGKSVERYINLNQNLQIGDQYIDFNLKNVNGKVVKLSDIKAKAILLDFWAAWCGPCRFENKNLVNTYKEFNSKGFEILGISGDKKEESWLKAIKEDGLVWENLRGEKGNDSDPFLIYGITGIPDNFLINKEGIIIGRNLRGEELSNKLKEIL